jgi:hypothetical protein
MALITPSRASGKLFGPVGRCTKFGWVTDCHNDPLKATDPAQGGKVYQDTIAKLTDIAAIFNARSDLAFVFQNGDFIDGSNSVSAAQADFASANAALNVNAPKYHNIGNHEMTQLTKPQILALTGQPGKWYTFVYGGVRFIVLDGNYTADDDSADLEQTNGKGGISPYISYIPPTQRQWLSDTIDASSYPCMIFCHYPLYYTGAFSWGLTNAAAVRTILEARSAKVIGALCGHLHDNYIKRVNGILYATVHATVTGAYPQLNYAVVSVFPDAKTFTIEAHGTQMTHVEAG